MSAPWSQNLASWATASPTRTDSSAHRSLSSLSRTAEQAKTDIKTFQASYVTEEASNICRSVGSDSASQSPQHSTMERPSPPPLLHYMPATGVQQSLSSEYRVHSARMNHSPSPAKEPSDLQAKWTSLSASFKGASTTSQATIFASLMINSINAQIATKVSSHANFQHCICQQLQHDTQTAQPCLL